MELSDSEAWPLDECVSETLRGGNACFKPYVTITTTAYRENPPPQNPHLALTDHFRNLVSEVEVTAVGLVLVDLAWRLYLDERETERRDRCGVMGRIKVRQSCLSSIRGFVVDLHQL